MQGSHGSKNKSLPHEESSGIPLIVRVPGGARNVVSDALVSGIDLFPTLLDSAGIESNGDDGPWLGRNFTPLLRGEKQALDGPVFSEMRKWRMVRKGDFKLVVEAERFSPTMLFDLKNDPYEQKNLVDDARSAPVIEDLRRELDVWRKECERTKV
jgi:choline-sulfatase